ncbi:major tail protein [Neobacillus niacini]|uniref:major tail protein n=1 Tax=Neobacillus niacini TaxID=86668 RepID=UPI000693C126|nr:major tail protein [Neobacillus niacini]
MVKKRLGGFKNIHVAPLTGSTYGTPVKIEGAKSIEAELSYEQVQFYADNAIDYNDFVFNGGEGTLTISGLTIQEYNTLFGATVNAGGVLVKSTDVAPELAILFERNKLGSNFKTLYAIYAVKFAPPAISAQTLEGGVEEETVELTFTVRALEDASVFYMVDSETAPALQVTDWYSTVQKPETV